MFWCTSVWVTLYRIEEMLNDWILKIFIIFFSINAKFFEHCNPSLLTTLKENMVSIDEKWGKVHESLSEKLTTARKLEPHNEDLVIVVEELDELEVSESRKLSSMSQDDTPLFEEFRTAFQEISDWISRAEAKLGKNLFQKVRGEI